MPRTIHALTGLRFFAAAAIVLHHSQNDYFFHKGTFQFFYLDRAVHLFFALSGFVLALNAEKYLTYADFVAARIARIWPAHLAGLLLCVALTYPGGLRWLGHPSQFGLLALNIALLQAWVPNLSVIFSYNAPSWSVSCELFFYLAFLPLFRLLKWNWLISGAVMFVGFGLLLWAGRTAALAVGITEENWLQYINPITNLPIFALGILTGVLFMRAAPASRPTRLATLIQGAVLVVVIFIDHMQWMPGFLWIDQNFDRFGREFRAAIVYCILCFVLSRYDGLPSSILAWPPIRYLGAISYSIYLIHQTIILWFSSDHAPLRRLPLALQAIAGTALIITLAAASHAIIETWLRRRIMRAWRSMREARLPRDALRLKDA